MVPRKKEEKEEDEITNEIAEQTKEIEDAMEFSLADIEGIGEVRLKKLNAEGIYKAEDLMIRGAKELADLLDMNTDQTQTMIENARKKSPEPKK